MPEHEQEEPVLKVSDRRHFTESGERRHDVDAAVFDATPPPPAAPKEKPSTAPAAKPTAGPAKEAPPKRERLAAREISFAGLLQDLYATGMLQMGAELQPGRPGQVDLEGARETIDLIGMLQEKTLGNLDAQEERLMQTVLYELRMAYVEVSQAGNRVQPARVAPPPPPPGRRR